MPREAIDWQPTLALTQPWRSFSAIGVHYSTQHLLANLAGAAAVGVQLAQPDRKVVALLGDGSAMYSIQALWTAAHHKLPMTFVVFNNGGYRIIKQRLKSFHGNDHFIGMDFADPKIDFTALAKSLGMPAEHITEPSAVGPALRRAFSTPGPKLLDVVVDGKV